MPSKITILKPGSTTNKALFLGEIDVSVSVVRDAILVGKYGFTRYGLKCSNHNGDAVY